MTIRHSIVVSIFTMDCWTCLLYSLLIIHSIQSTYIVDRRDKQHSRKEWTSFLHCWRRCTSSDKQTDSDPYCFNRSTNWPDAAATRQCHSPEEQQPAGDHCGVCRSRHRRGCCHSGTDLHTAFFCPTEEVSWASSACLVYFLLCMYDICSIE